MTQPATWKTSITDAADRRWVIGVDGGGTKTEAVLATVAPHRHGTHDSGQIEVVASQIAGPSNLQQIPIESALREVAAAVQPLWQPLYQAGGRIEAGCFAMAGSGNPQLKDQFQRWLHQQGWIERSEITHDSRAVIAAGTRSDTGVALIAGTGSIAYGRTTDDHQARCGGWRNLVSDEGSAYWVAVEGFRHALHAVDRRGRATRLLDDLTQWIGGPPPTWPQQLATLPRDQIARAAGIVTAAAEGGDGVADAIVTAAAKELATMIATVAGQLFAGQSFELALAGGLVCNCQLLRVRVGEQLREWGKSPSQIECVAHPAHGAARIAAQSRRQAPPL